MGDVNNLSYISRSFVNNSHLIFARSDNWFYNNVISGTGAVTKLGAGTLNLEANQTYTGTTTVDQGTLQIGSGSVAGNITNNSALIFNRSNNYTYDGTISGNGSLTKLGPFTLTLTNNKSGTGTTTISAGTLSIGGSAVGDGTIQGNITVNPAATINFSQSNIVINTSNFTINGTLHLNGFNERFASLSGNGSITTTATNGRLIIDTDVGTSSDFSGIMSGPGRIILSGSNPAVIQTLSGNNTYTGTSTVSAGALSITGSMSGNITNHAGLIFNRASDLTYTGLISGAGTLTKLGAGTLTLPATQSFTGTTTVSGGTLAIGGSADSTGIVQGDLNIEPGGTLTFLQSNVVKDTSHATVNGSMNLGAFSEQIASLSGSGSVVTTASGAILELDLTSSSTFSGVISGQGQLWIRSQQASNIQTLTGNNTYTGITRIFGGTLQIGDGSTTGALESGLISFENSSTAMIFKRSNDSTFAGTFFGPGTITKMGAGTLVLSNRLLRNSGITLVSGGTLQFGDGGEHFLFTSGITNNATVAFNHSNDLVYSQPITGNGSITKLGTGKLTLTGNKSGSGLTTIFAGSLQIGNGGNTGSVLGSITNNSALIFDRSDAVTHSGTISGSGSLTKTGSGTLTLPGNQPFTGTTTVASGTLIIGGSASPNGNLQANVLVDQGATLRHAQSNIVKDTSNYTINGTLELGGFSESIATLSGSGAITTTAATGILNLDLGSSTNFSGTISGPGGLTLRGNNGTATQTLSGNNTYTGVTTINGGTTLQLGNGGATGGINGAITINSGGTLLINRSSDYLFTGVINGSGTLTKLGTGNLTLSSSNTYTGITTISAGTLTAASTSALPGFSTSGKVTVAPGATLSVQPNSQANTWTQANIDTLRANATFAPTSDLAIDTTNGDFTYASSFTASSQLRKLGANTLKLTGSITNNNLTTISAGTLQIGDGGTTGSFAGNIANNASLTLNRSDDLTYSDTISGSGSLNKLSSGTLVLAGNNTYTGGTTISAGVLRIGTINTPGFITGDITNNARLSFASSIDQTYSGNISGNGALIKINLGKLTLTGNNTYTGPTSIDGGTLVITGATQGTSAITFGGGILGLDIAFPVTAASASVDFSGQTVLITGTPTLPSYTLLSALSISGTAPVLASPAPSGYELQVVSNQLRLVQSAGGSTYHTWATSTGLTGLPGSSTDPSKYADPDNDGRNNLAEFAFNGDPLNGADNGKVFVLTEDSDFDGDTIKELILTIAVRTGTPVFSGTPSPTAVQAADGITYGIEGSLDLIGFSTIVNVMPTPLGGGLSPAGMGYEYRSFSLDGSNGLTSKGFLRAKVTSP